MNSYHVLYTKNTEVQIDNIKELLFDKHIIQCFKSHMLHAYITVTYIQWYRLRMCLYDDDDDGDDDGDDDNDMA